MEAVGFEASDSPEVVVADDISCDDEVRDVDPGRAEASLLVAGVTPLADQISTSRAKFALRPSGAER